MSDNIQLISTRFAKAHDNYAKHAHIQNQITHQLMAFMQAMPLSPSCVLEIGCGVGNLTKQLLSHYPNIQQLILNDLYDAIQSNDLPAHTASVEYLLGDINQLPLPDATMDLIVSSSALQWIYPLDGLIAKLANCLTKGGYLALSSFGVDNLQEIKQLTKQGLTYYHCNQLLALCQHHKLHISICFETHHTLYFHHPYDVLRHLKHTGVTGLGNFRWSKSALNHFINHYPDTPNQGHPLTYHPIYIIAQK